MKKILLTILLTSTICFTQTKNFVPRANDEGAIGTTVKNWGMGWFRSVHADTVYWTFLNPAIVSFPGFGTSGSTACVGNDSRLSDARTPLAHNQTKSTITDFAHTHPESEVTNLVADLGNKQATLVSGTNIKTVNGNSLLGSGDLVVGGGSTPTGTGWRHVTSGVEDGVASTPTASQVGAEPALGNPGTNGYVLSSTTGGTRSWIAPGGGSGLGYCLNVQAASQATTTDAQTIYWGGMIVAPSTTANRWRVYIPKSGTIKAVYIYSYAGTAGTNEAWAMNIRVNNTSDYLVQSLSAATVDRVWSNVALSIAVTEGQYIEIKEVCPTWATNPATVTRCGQIYIE